MNGDLAAGFGLILLGAVFGGTFALPSKFAGKIPWEALWGAFFVFVTLLLPLPLARLFLPEAVAIWKASGWALFLLPMAFGFLWGLGSFTNAISISLIGLSLAYAINFGMQTSTGSILPFLVQQSTHINTPHGRLILAGILVCVIGVCVCGYVGILKDRAMGKANVLGDAPRPKIRRGVILCVISGVFCACLNLAFSFGAPMMALAQNEFAVAGPAATLAVWVPAFLGGFISAGGYCAWKLTQNKTWSSFRGPGAWRVIALALLMAVLHDGAIFLYGAGTRYIGELGTSAGFAIFTSGIMVVGSVTGFLTGEWRECPRSMIGKMILGVAVIVGGICILAIGNGMMG
jgi:L-rhamnose-H+ transport protein